MKCVVIYDSQIPEEEFVKLINEKTDTPVTKVLYIGEAEDEEALEYFIDEQREEFETKKRRLH